MSSGKLSRFHITLAMGIFVLLPFPLNYFLLLFWRMECEAFCIFPCRLNYMDLECHWLELLHRQWMHLLEFCKSNSLIFLFFLLGYIYLSLGLFSKYFVFKLDGLAPCLLVLNILASCAMFMKASTYLTLLCKLDLDR